AGAFGPIMARKYDMGTHVATAVQQGAQNFRCVRVTDGTDAAAYAIIPATNASFTALHTGSLGNQIAISLTPSSKPSSWKLTVSLPGYAPEVFDGLTGDGLDFWSGVSAAVNTGQGPQRGPSALVIATAGGTTASPAPFSLNLGATSVGSD